MNAVVAALLYGLIIWLVSPFVILGALMALRKLADRAHRDCATCAIDAEIRHSPDPQIPYFQWRQP